MKRINLHTAARWTLAAILCAAWAFAHSSDILAGKPGSKPNQQNSKFKQVELGIDYYDDSTRVYTYLSVRGTTDTAEYRPADFYWSQYDESTGSSFGVWGYVAGPVSFSTKRLESATWTAPMVVYVGSDVENPILGTFDVEFTGTGTVFRDTYGWTRLAVAEGTIFLDLNRNDTVDEGELLDLTHYWARLSGW